MNTVVYLGNFKPNFSTESHLAWTWENKLGWKAIRLQEGQASSSDVLAACSGAQLFEWSHTHGWKTPGQYTMLEVLERVRRMGVPSFSYHLDLYWGLNLLDRRQDQIGQHAQWKVDRFFSTDGSSHPWAERGVNHSYLSPGVVEYGAYQSQNRIQGSEIAFVGSGSYHPEYNFRKTLIESVQNHYPGRFRIFSGYRETNLNDLYASVKIVIGDHCFAGIPHYWSDRLPETTGRGGFIIYPATQGLEDFVTYGLVTFEPRNLSDLYSKIDYFLAHDAEREERRKSVHEYVKKNHTYTQKLEEILRVMGVH